MRDKEFYTIQEFAEKVCACYRTIYNGIRKGQISAIRLGGGKRACYRIPHSEIQRLGILNFSDVLNTLIDAKFKERDEREE